MPNPNGGWDVKMPHAERSSGHFDTQEEAIDRAREILRNDGGGELRIHGENGQIRDSDSVPSATSPINARHVVPDPEGGWDVKMPDAERASGHFDTQEDAINRAREILQNDGGGELRIHGENGQIREANTIEAR